MPSFPRDRFDEIPSELERVGAHRAERRRGAAWLAVGGAALVTVVLVVVGVAGLQLYRGGLAGPGASGGVQQASPQEETRAQLSPVLKPGMAVTVLNGTAGTGVAASIGARLEDAGWTVGSEASASQSDVEQTVVYYSSPLYEGAARGLALDLGVEGVQLSASVGGSSVTVVVGADLAEQV